MIDDLVARCQRREPRAERELFATYREAVYRTLTRLLGNRAAVEDALQDAFIAVFRALPGFRGDSTFRTWMERIVVRTAYDHLRRPKRRLVPLELLPAEEEPRTARDPGAELDEAAAHARLGRLLERLDARKRIAFVLFALEGRSVEEVAQLTGATRVGVRSRVMRARQQLTRWIERDPALAVFLDRKVGGGRRAL